MSEHIHLDAMSDDEHACALALANVQAFLHGELPETDADHIRAHLMACERCMDDFDVETTITQMVRRCCPPQTASMQLRMRISQLSISFREQ